MYHYQIYEGFRSLYVTIQIHFMSLNAIKKTLKQCDLFGTPVKLNRKGDEEYQSMCGGIVSICIVLFVLLYFSSQIASFAFKEQVNVTEDTLFTDQTDALTLELPKFMFALGVEQGNLGFAQRPYFHVSVNQKTKVNGTANKKFPDKKIALKPCTNQSFQHLGYTEQQVEQTFSQQQITTYLCPSVNKEQEVQLQGNFLSEYFTYLKISIIKCSNSTKEDLVNVFKDPLEYYDKGLTPPCAPQKEIDDYFASLKQFRVSVYTTNSVVNPQKTYDYETPYLADDLSFIFQPGLQYKSANVFYYHYKVDTDTSLFVDQQIVTDNYVIRDPYAYQEQTLLVKNQQEDDSYIDIYLRRGNIDQKASRSFMKIDFLVSYLGGFVEFILIIFEFFMLRYNEFYLRVKLVNTFYDCRKQTGHKHLPRPPPQKGASESVKNSEYILTKSQIEKLGFKNKRDFLLYYFSNYIDVAKKLKVTFSYLLYLFTCRKKFKTENNQIVDSALDKIEKDLDVTKLISHYLEFDKLKEILLEQDQKNLLDFIPKPKVQLLENTDMLMTKSQINESRFNQFLDVVDSFDTLMYRYQNGDIDGKSLNLIAQLGDEVRKIFLISTNLYKAHEKKYELNRMDTKMNHKKNVSERLTVEIAEAKKISRRLTLDKNKLDQSSLNEESPQKDMGRSKVEALVGIKSTPQDEQAQPLKYHSVLINEMKAHPTFNKKESLGEDRIDMGGSPSS